MKITPQIKKLLAKKSTRIKLCERSDYLFGAYYFSHYFTHKSALYQLMMCKDLEFNGFQFLLWIMFRESTKTAWAKIKVVKLIVYGHKKNIAWGGHDEKKAKKNVMSIANELQANKKIINDFGQLFYEDISQRKQKKSKKKSFSEFSTENGVSVRSISPRQPQRGDGVDQFRPDFYVLDDLENVKTARSKKITRSTIEFIEEIMTGLSVDAEMIFLGNWITDKGVMAWLKKKTLTNDNFKLRQVAIKEGGKIVWPGKYVETKAEARKINAKIKNKKHHVKSLEQLRRDYGTALFNQEFMNKARQKEGAIIKDTWIRYYERGRLKRGKKSGAYYYQFPGDKLPTKGITLTAIDPAVSEKDTSDDRAICTIARFDRIVDEEIGEKESYYLIVRCVAGKWTLAKFGQELKKQKENNVPKMIGCESNGVQLIFRKIFQKNGISTKAINPKGDKASRMYEHEADFEFGFVLFPDDGSEAELIDELTNFTGEDGGEDNRVDAMNMAIKMAKEYFGGVYVTTF